MRNPRFWGGPRPQFSTSPDGEQHETPRFRLRLPRRARPAIARAEIVARGGKRMPTRRLLLCVVVTLALGNTWACGQDYAPPDPVLPFPLGSTRPEDGGFFASHGYTL